MRTIEEVVADILDFDKCEVSSRNLTKFANEILEIHKAEARPKGKWYIKDTEPLECECWDCSECRETVFEKTNFCPDCGADMRTESEEK